jgi:DNA invertase Pin-like site-specific DNA recombinase
MKVGYARVSSRGQSLELQHSRLQAAGCDKIFEEKRSGGKGTDRPALADTLEFVREGDTLVITKLDRLARSVTDLASIADTLARKGVGFVVLDQPIDTTTPTGRLIYNVLGAIAEFERELIAERRMDGIEDARKKGVKFGRKPKLTDADKTAIRTAHQGGAHWRDLMATYGVGKSHLYRIIALELQSPLKERRG